MAEVVVSGIFDNPRSLSIRFLQEAARLGPVHLLLWSDAAVENFTGRAPKFPAPERRYFLESIRYIQRVTLLEQVEDPDSLPLALLDSPQAWVMPAGEDTSVRQIWCAENQVACWTITPAQMAGFPEPDSAPASGGGRKKVVVTGCYDWLHSGHVRFFEEASAYGELTVCIGSDANVRMLKGEGHPLIVQNERRFMVGAIRFVHQVWINSGWGMLDAAPEIERLQPDLYLVNEDGDTAEKREFCAARGLEYVVLKREPKSGLQRRSSTHLRGF
jgi:cytidyltransferase-like protein